MTFKTPFGVAQGDLVPLTRPTASTDRDKWITNSNLFPLNHCWPGLTPSVTGKAPASIFGLFSLEVLARETVVYAIVCRNKQLWWPRISVDWIDQDQSVWHISIVDPEGPIHILAFETAMDQHAFLADHLCGLYGKPLSPLTDRRSFFVGLDIPGLFRRRECAFAALPPFLHFAWDTSPSMLAIAFQAAHEDSRNCPFLGDLLEEMGMDEAAHQARRNSLYWALYASISTEPT
jgi:hypothetical protein